VPSTTISATAAFLGTAGEQGGSQIAPGEEAAGRTDGAFSERGPHRCAKLATRSSGTPRAIFGQDAKFIGMSSEFHRQKTFSIGMPSGA